MAISLATLSKKPEKRANVVANGGVAALTKLSRSEESRTRSSCAEVCSHAHCCCLYHIAKMIAMSIDLLLNIRASIGAGKGRSMERTYRDVNRKNI